MFVDVEASPIESTIELVSLGVGAGLAAVALTAVGVRLLPEFKSRETKPGRYRPGPKSSSRLTLVGGSALVVAFGLSAAPAAALGIPIPWQALAAGFIFFAIGLADDLRKAVKARGFADGASFALAVAASLAAAGAAMALQPGMSASVFSLAHWLEPGIASSILLFFWAAGLFLTITVGAGISDGVDGLTAGLSAIAAAALAVSAVQLRTSAAAAVALAGASAGFLILNLPSNWSPASQSRRRRASAYLGDSGALALGGLLTAAAFAAGLDLLLPIVAGVYLLEGLSSFVQAKLLVPLYRRIAFLGGPDRLTVHYSSFPLPFVAAPLHHHLELVGMSRRNTVALLWSLGAALALLGVWAVSPQTPQAIAAAYGLAGLLLVATWLLASAFRPAFFELVGAGGAKEIRLCHGRPGRLLGLPTFSVVDRRQLDLDTKLAGLPPLGRPMNPNAARQAFEALGRPAENAPETAGE